MGLGVGNHKRGWRARAGSTTYLTAAWWSGRAKRAWSDWRASQMLRRLSLPPLARVVPSGDHLRPHTCWVINVQCAVGKHAKARKQHHTAHSMKTAAQAYKKTAAPSCRKQIYLLGVAAHDTGEMILHAHVVVVDVAAAASRRQSGAVPRERADTSLQGNRRKR